MTDHRISSNWLLVLGFTFLTAPLAWFAMRLVDPASQLAEQLDSDLYQFGKSQVRVQQARLARLGPDGIRLLVEQLDHSDPDAARGAHLTLRKQLEQWRALSVEDSSPRVADLVHFLATTNRTQPSSQKMAAELASEVLAWPLDRTKVQGSAVVADCETVLLTAIAANLLSNESDDAVDLSATESIATAARTFDTSAPQVPAQANNPPPRIEGTDEPDESAGTLLTERPPELLTALPQKAERQDDQQSLSDVPEPPLVAERGPVESRMQSIRTNLPLQEMYEFEVVRLLASPHAAWRQAAETELIRRGFEATQLQLAKLLVDRDPKVRQKVANQLFGIVGIDTRTWLIWLSRDPDAGVRETAISVMATSNDPVLQRQLLIMEREEADPAVLRYVRRR